MWILTQNRKRIISTEGLSEITVAEPAEGRMDYAVMMQRRTDGRPFALGFYRRQERAMDVLKGLADTQANYIACDDGGHGGQGGGSQPPRHIMIPPKVYEMPPDGG